MPVTTREQLGASTHNRKWWVDVNTGTTAEPNWVGVFGIGEFQPTAESNMEDDTDAEGAGWQSEGKTAEKWGLTFKVRRKLDPDNPNQYNEGQEFLRNKAEGQFGINNIAEIRYYEMEDGGPRVMAYQGMVAVQWSPDGGAMTVHDIVTVTLSGRGARTPITHPAAEDSVPVISTIDPDTGDAAGGDLVTLTGNSFTSATDVQFDGGTADGFTVVDDFTIVAIVPAGVAGAVDVTVVAPAGTSDPVTYTYT